MELILTQLEHDTLNNALASQSQVFSFESNGLYVHDTSTNFSYDLDSLLNAEYGITYQTFINQKVAEAGTISASIKVIIENAMTFGHDMMVEFATENVMMGITQAGKTRDVSTLLADVAVYLNTGSLYEVVAEIERIKANGISGDLAPFVTVARLDAFKLKITNYLGL